MNNSNSSYSTIESHFRNLIFMLETLSSNVNTMEQKFDCLHADVTKLKVTLDKHIDSSSTYFTFQRLEEFFATTFADKLDSSTDPTAWYHDVR